MSFTGKKKIGILTSGGDCPGLNAAIRGVVKALLEKESNIEIIGFENGYRGLIENKKRIITDIDVSNILTLGGTFLGTSREKPFKEADKSKALIAHYIENELDGLVVLGGNGTHKTANAMRLEGLNVIGLPKTIDNDIAGTDISFGFQTAVDIATLAIDRLHSTAESHNRVMVMEVMGHKVGWLALHAGIAGGGDVILLPEIPYNLDKVVNHIHKRAANGKRFSIVVVAEGALSQKEANMSKEELKRYKKHLKYPNVGYTIAGELESKTGFETRVTVLGYQQRGGTPSAFDRVLATRLGTAAAELIFAGNYGKTLAVRGEEIIPIPLEEVAGQLKSVPPQHPLVKSAKSVHTCFGD
jgi:6-phosphofructokinase 1